MTLEEAKQLEARAQVAWADLQRIVRQRDAAYDEWLTAERLAEMARQCCQTPMTAAEHNAYPHGRYTALYQ